MSQEDTSKSASDLSGDESLEELVSATVDRKLAAFKKEFSEYIETKIPKHEQFETTDDLLITENSNDHYAETGLCAKNRLYWQNKAKEELEDARKTNLSSLEGVQTVLCIDTSDSMKESNTWIQTKQFCSDYISGLRDEFSHHRNHHNTAIVTFGEETKVAHRLTKDISMLQDVIDKIKCGGPSPLAAGLIFSKVAIESTLFPCAKVSKIQEIPPRIIVITDGKTSNPYAEHQPQEDKNKVFSCVKDEVTDIRNERIEIHFIFVGTPNIEFLYNLSEISNGELLPSTSGWRLAKGSLTKWLLENEKDFVKCESETNIGKEDKSIDENSDEVDNDDENENTNGKDEEGLIEDCQIDDKARQLITVFSTMNHHLKEAFCCLQKIASVFGNGENEETGRIAAIQSLLPVLEKMLRVQTSMITEKKSVDDMEKILVKHCESMDVVLKVLKTEINPNYYKEVPDMQTYAPIGARVRRGEDWRWGNQDNGGLGTIIGHLDDRLRKYWCCVEWDIDGNINAYRYEMNGKRDLVIVEEERIPENGSIISVGSNVTPGDDYEGQQTHVLGIAIQFLDDDKVQVRWNDNGSREELTYGINGTPQQIVPALKKVNETESEGMPVNKGDNPENPPFRNTSKPEPPANLEYYDVFESTASLRWQKSVDDKEGRNAKYFVTYRETENPKKEITINVDAGLCYTLDELKRGSEYTAFVKLRNDDGRSLESKTVSFKTMKTDTDDSHYAGWKLTDSDAARLTSAIGENWEMLGPAFGIGTIPFHRIKSDNQTSTLRIYHMVLYWVKTDENPTFGKFLKVLRNAPEVSICQSAIQLMKEDFQLKECNKDSCQKLSN